MNLELNVVKFDNEDVIATSGEVTYTLGFGYHEAQGQLPAHYHVFKLEDGVAENQLPAANALTAGEVVSVNGTDFTLTGAGNCTKTTNKAVFNRTAYITGNVVTPAQSFKATVVYDGEKYTTLD